MKKTVFFAVLSAIISLSSCSADFDSYREVCRGEIAKLYFMEDNQPYIDIKVSADSILEYPVISHKDYTGRFKEFRKGDYVIVFQFLKKVQPRKYFICSPGFSQKDFEKIMNENAASKNWGLVVMGLFSIIIGIFIKILCSYLSD